MIKGEKKLRKKLEGITDEWYRLLGMDQWMTVAVRFSTEVDGERILAECTSDWEYRQCSIKWNLPMAAIRTDAELKSAALHELIHFFTSVLAVKLPEEEADREEFAVESLTIAIIHMAESLKK